MNNSEVALAYVNKRVNKRTGDCSFKGSNMFYEDDVIYSYGYHFPMAIRLYKEDGSEYYLFNNDSYSNSTSKHQHKVYRELSDVQA